MIFLIAESGKSAKEAPLHDTDDTDGINADDHLNHRSDPEGCCHDDIVITEDLIDPDYLLDPPENWEFEVNATSAKELEARGYLRTERDIEEEESEDEEEEEQEDSEEGIHSERRKKPITSSEQYSLKS